MRARTWLFCAVSLLISSLAIADTAAEGMQSTRPQRPYNAPALPAVAPPPPGVAGVLPAADAPPPPSREVVVINLDNTGVSDWTFINPRRPAKIMPRVGLQFRNVTADRTFVVSIPVTFKTSDVSIRLAVLNREIGEAEERIWRITTALLPGTTAPTLSLTDVARSWPWNTDIAILETIDSHGRVRELIRDVDSTNPKAIESLDLTAYRHALASPDFLTSHVAIEAAADVVPKPLAPLATRLRTLAARLRGLGTLETPTGESDVRAAKQRVIDRLRVLNSHLAANPTSAEVRTERDELEKILAGTTTPPVRSDVLLQRFYLQNELLRLRDDYRLLELYVLPLKSRIETSGGLDQVAYTPERVAAVKEEVLRELDGTTKSLFDQRKKALDDRIVALQEQESRRRQYLWTWVRPAARRDATQIDQRIALRQQVLDDLSGQGVTDAEEALENRFGVEFSGCATEDGTLSCTASQTIPQNQTAIFSERFLREATPAESVFTFNVRFFDETDAPSYPTVYLTRAANKPKAPPNSFSWNLVGAVGQARDPEILTAAPTDGTPPSARCTTLRLCAEGHRNHFIGVGQVQLKQRIADYFEGSATVAFKSGDLGTPSPRQTLSSDGTVPKDEVTFSQYKFVIFAENGWALEFGKQTFAAPSNGISIREVGEGFRLIFQPAFISGAYLVKREGDKFLANRANRDSWVALLQASNIPLMTFGVFRSLNMTYVRGFERRLPAENPMIPYDYETFGGDVSYAVPILNVNGNIGGYYNRRNADNDTVTCTLTNPCNARGSALIGTLTRSFGLDPKNKPKRSVTITFARGSGDDNTTANVNEGYTGETGSFVPDVIFLKSLVGPMNGTNLGDVSGLPQLRFGTGISNKTYFGASYVDNEFSLLHTLVHDVFHVNDITSYSTTLKYHNYRLREPVDGARGAGHEFDLEFMIEGPRGVKTTVGAGWYLPGRATIGFVDRSLWSAYSNVSVSFGQ